MDKPLLDTPNQENAQCLSGIEHSLITSIT